MWHSKLKCQKIGALVKASHKRLKVVLASGVKNFGPASVASKLVEFPLFDNFFPDLVKFQDLNIFSNFLVCSTLPPTPNPLILPLPTPSYSEVDLFYSIVIFSIKVSGAAILLKS